MVVPKKCFVKDGDKSPSPQPFEEPEGMVTIDLNSDSSSKDDGGVKSASKEKENRKRGKRACTTIFYLILFMTVIFATLVFIDDHFHILKWKSARTKLAKNNAISFEKTVQNLYATEKRNQLLKCVVSKTFKDCCKIFSDKEFPELIEICTVNEILDLIEVTFENDVDIRKKRDVALTYEDQAPVSKDNDEDLVQYLHDFGTLIREKLPETPFYRNNFPKDDANSKDYQDVMYGPNYDYENYFRRDAENVDDYDNYFSTDELNNDVEQIGFSDYGQQAEPVLPTNMERTNNDNIITDDVPRQNDEHLTPYSEIQHLETNYVSPTLEAITEIVNPLFEQSLIPHLSGNTPAPLLNIQVPYASVKNELNVEQFENPTKSDYSAVPSVDESHNAPIEIGPEAQPKFQNLSSNIVVSHNPEIYSSYYTDQTIPATIETSVDDKSRSKVVDLHKLHLPAISLQEISTSTEKLLTISEHTSVDNNAGAELEYPKYFENSKFNRKPNQFNEIPLSTENPIVPPLEIGADTEATAEFNDPTQSQHPASHFIEPYRTETKSVAKPVPVNINQINQLVTFNQTHKIGGIGHFSEVSEFPISSETEAFPISEMTTSDLPLTTTDLPLTTTDLPLTTTDLPLSHLSHIEDISKMSEDAFDSSDKDNKLDREHETLLQQKMSEGSEDDISKLVTAAALTSEELLENVTNKSNNNLGDFSKMRDAASVNTKSDFSSARIELVPNQPGSQNPCFYPYQYPAYKFTSPFEGSQVLKIVPLSSPKTAQYMVNPPMYPYMQTPYIQPPQYFPNYVQPVQPENSNTQVHVSGPGGQYYLCNPVPAPTNNVVNMPGVEIRREAANLQALLEDFSSEVKESNKTRASDIICPSGQFGCEDGSRCVPKYQVCDNEIHCEDGSDEWYCSCKERVGRLRVCDGYFDCPNGEDEVGCFGCAPDEFSCDDWSKFRKSTCIPIHQRCDNIRQCTITGKDEEDCSILTDRVGGQQLNKISNTVGFLHRNYKGQWYPTCFGTEIWAMEICKIEGGPSAINPRSHMMLTMNNYDGNYINILPNNEISLVRTCVTNRAAFVDCPPLFCGLRMTIKNPYRPQEVDTSAEEMLNDLERVGGKLGADVLKNANKTNASFVGISRVVGGKPSQPAAWPWLVSIYKNGIFHCGGVLVNELWVVTAAHCLDKYWQYYYEIQAGMLRRFSYSPMEQRRWVAMVIPHENYDKSTLKNDIGLMKISSPIRFNRYVRPICLPSDATAGKNFLAGPSDGTICTTVGWGATIEHGSDPDHMREVEVPVLSHCKHRDDEEGEEICAGLSEGGKDACQGDSGGPFMCRNPNNPSQWYLAGIVSHGEGCARPDEPGVYTRVSRFVGWLAENIEDLKPVSRIPLQRCPGFICKGTEKCIPKRHHCDKIVDCLFADDEMNCKYGLHNFFKHAKDPYLGATLEDQDPISTELIPNMPLMDSNTTEYSADNMTYIINEETGSSDNVSSENQTSYETSTTKSDTVNHDTKSSPFFKCTNLLQVIPSYQRCDKKFDCEDGTDELNCLCVDYIKNYNSSAICDGIMDCYDLSDENTCVTCQRTSEYHCRQSHTCVDLAKRCDGVLDCKKGEDEWDCAALTDGATLTLDSDLRPQLAMSGIITINRFGVWRPFCASANVSDEAPSIATNVCNLLGFEEYVAYRKYLLEDKPLDVTTNSRSRNGEMEDRKSASSNDTCEGLYIKCSNVSLDSSLHSVYLDNVTRDVELYTSPWNAAIYSDGIYRCMGTILNSNWIVTSVNCFKGITTLNLHYVTALLGKGKAQLELKGPHEEIVRVVETDPIEGTDILLLGLDGAISFSRYIKYIMLNIRRDGRRKERCYGVGLHKNKTKFVPLTPIENCYIGHRCFGSKMYDNCEDSSGWSGTIVCDSGSGWYPAAVFSEPTGHCGLSSVKNYTSLRFFKNKINNVIKRTPFKQQNDTPTCNGGFRCILGECLDISKTCNGIPDCLGGEDEDPELCYENEMQCHLTGSCACPQSSLKCNNNKCIPKSSFCDRKKDCEDGEDEPDLCSCRNYLMLTNPSKICDGVINCLDRSDEDPWICPCFPYSFRCGNSSLCVPNDAVCDGINDCPDGEDEKKCLSIDNGLKFQSNAGEILTRTAGIWHRGCFHQNHTVVETEQICEMLGFPESNASLLTPPKNVHNVTSLRPEIDPFSNIWIHRAPGNALALGIRTGNEPYLKFVPDEGCFRLFLACM